ncbi:hypothetical protein CHH28_17410 [Bacterioplanes sanyensis]|uniref:Uncharacterized protein n=1 Tax=Bacterioplanes sanyensis TaxID=1249553 RepID=A0A222FPA4_9GAMM|nr:hypothetical protein [Bacterioplanes sanyensis]ASP40344.1 hypothetical protein CHH28_17410 [Bacterioplanes sanyensis]
MVKDVPSPIPLQNELLEVPGSVALLEYQTAFKNDSTHLPEVSLRYLIYLILDNKPDNEIQRFALQIRSDLNAERLETWQQQATQNDGACH